MTDSAEVVGCGCNRCLTRAEIVRKPAEKHKTENIKGDKQIEESVRYPATSNKTLQEVVDAHARKINRKKPTKPYKAILSLPETAEVSLFQNKDYPVFVIIGFNALQRRLIVCVLNTGVGSNLVRANALNPGWLDFTRQRGILDNCSASNTELKVSGTIKYHLRMGI